MAGDCTGAEIKVPSVENPELTNVLPLKHRVGQNTHVVVVDRFYITLFSTLDQTHWLACDFA